MRHSALLLLVLSASPALAASGGSAVTLSHSGYVLDSGDHPLAGSADFVFRLTTASTGGTVEWAGACAAVPVRQGYYAVQLGSAECVGSTSGGLDATLDTADLPTNAARWLEVEVEGVLLTPRLAINVAPAAAVASHALDADRLGGLLPTAFAPATHPHAIADVTGLQAALDGKLAAEVDPKVGTITEGKWCTATGGKVVCASDPPVTGLVAPATATAVAGALRFSGGHFQGYNGTAWLDLDNAVAPTIAGVGGTMTTDASGNKLHTYTTVGNASFTPTGSGTVEVLVVGGGGGSSGGYYSGGGGGGGVIYQAAYAVTAGQAVTVTVGAGGSGGAFSTLGTRGSDSTFGSIIAVGGGIGGSSHGGNSNGQVGGSGGGSSLYCPGVGGPGTSGQGNAGGSCSYTTYSSSYGGGAGGGGAGGPGENSIYTAPGSGGRGGNGLTYSISGASMTYGGGGGGGAWSSGAGLGGTGGGGNGAPPGSATGGAGTANTGGGGGGTSSGAGGAGGSGIVIVRYPR